MSDERSEREQRVIASLIDPATRAAATNTAKRYGLAERHFFDDIWRKHFAALAESGADVFKGMLGGLPACDDSIDDPDELEAAVRRIVADAAKPYLAALKKGGVVFERADAFMTRPIPQPDWIIPDFIARGMKGDLPAPSKMRKTFFTMQLAASIAAGRDFCGVYKIPTPRRVLYCNLELMDYFAQERLRTQTNAAPELCNGLQNLTIANLRGTGHHIREEENAASFIGAIRAEDFALVILDPQYKLMEQTEDENTGQGISGILRFRDRIASETGAAVLFVCHDAKGNAGERKVTDRGAGSGWAGRDFDFRITLTPHADGDPLHVVVAGENRNRKPPPPFTAVFDETTMTFTAAPEIAPEVETTKTRNERRAKENAQAEADARMLAEMLTGKPMTHKQICEESKAQGMTARRFNAAWNNIKNQLEKYGLVKYEITIGKGKPAFFGKPDEVKAAAKTALQYWQNAQAGRVEK